MNQRVIRIVLVLALATHLLSAQVIGTSSVYRQTNLVSDIVGKAANVDRSLLDPIGIAFKPGRPFFLAAKHRGAVKTYDANGFAEPPGLFAVPVPVGQQPPGSPVGIVYDTTGEFQIHSTQAEFIVASDDGIISAWCCVDGNQLQVAAVARDNSARNAVYKGVAILTPECCAPFVAVTNFNSGSLETYTPGFAPLVPAGSFLDPRLPAGYAPFGIQVINSQVFITYALQDKAKHDPVTGPGNGIVDVFDLEGNFLRRFASNGILNAPWGVAKASANFGVFSNAILIGNFGDGTINAFDPTSGRFLGTLKKANGQPITNRHLWALAFESGGTGAPDTLYFTAGLHAGQHGLFGAISVKP